MKIINIVSINLSLCIGILVSISTEVHSEKIVDIQMNTVNKTSCLLQNNCSKWVMGYLPTYQQDGNGSVSFMTSTEYDKLTHIIHLGPYVTNNGSLDMTSNGATTQRLSGGVLSAHSNNTPILLSFQGWYTDYLPALQNPTSRTALVNNILNLFDTYSYDGIDVDLEPVMSPYVSGIQSGNSDYVTFINELWSQLQTRYSPLLNRKPLLTVAANGYAAPVLKTLESKFDMINILTYDLSGPYPGWVTWHDSPVYSGGNIMPSTGLEMPSVNSEIQLCLSSGISASKLGIGVSFDAFRWAGGTGTVTGGVTAPMQSYTSDPSWTRFSYSDFFQNYYDPTKYHYDNTAKMSYLGIDNTGSANDQFWSYNDEQSCIDKVNYVWSNNLGGMMLWELKSGYIPTNTTGNRIPQLNYLSSENCKLYVQSTACAPIQCGSTSILKN